MRSQDAPTLLLLAALSGTSTPVAHAQSAVPPATNPPSSTTTPQTSPPTAAPPKVAGAPTPKPIKLGDYTISIYNRTRIENFDFFDGPAPNGDGNYNFVGNLLRVGIGQTLPKYDFQFEVAQPTLFNLPTTAAPPFSPAPAGVLGLGGNYFQANNTHGSNNDNPAGIFVKQAFVRFKGLGDPANSLRLGRFEFAEGAEAVPKNASLAFLKRERIAQRIIGPFGFSHVGRSFDGAQFVNNVAGKRNVTLFAARATEGVFQVHGNGELDVDIAYAAYTQPKINSDARVFLTSYRDRRGVTKVDSRPLAARTADAGNGINIQTLGGHYLKAFKAGKGQADVLAWGALQYGGWGNQRHKANALALEAGYQPTGVKFKPWFRAGYYRGSGDENPVDGRHGTFFQMLPTPRIYARFPFYNMMNNEDIFVQGILRPNPKTTIRADAHRLRLADSSDLYYSGGGAFSDDNFGYAGRPSGGDSSLASLYDLSVDYQLNARTQIGAYLAFAPGGDVIKNIYKRDDSGRYAFLEVTNRF